MNIESQHNLLDQLANYRQCVRKAKRLRNLCLKQTRRMYRQRHHMPTEQEVPFMTSWWALVANVHECAVKLEDNDATFLNALNCYRTRAGLIFTDN